MTINEALTALAWELADADVPAPLAQPFTLAALWLDLCRLAGEAPPAEVATIIDAPIGEPAAAPGEGVPA